MKKTWLLGILILFFLAGCLVYVRDPYDRPPAEGSYYDQEMPAGDLDFGYFHNQLSPYGYWVDMPGHGYVWIPNQVEYGWRPYTRGRWMWTDFGWTWASEYRWGWAPFHYGRWGWDDGFGWFWVPGSTWGPAWVSWRHGSSYVGWAPLPPGVRFVAGVGITSMPLNLHHRYWVFMDGRYLTSAGLYRYVLPWERNSYFIGRTVARTQIVMRDRWVVNQGLDLNTARRISRRTINKVQLADARRPGATRVGGSGLEIYRPRITENRTVAPRSVIPRSEIQERVTRDRIRVSESGPQTSLRQRQENEDRLLRSSQEREARELQQKAEADKRTARTADEKRRVEQEYEAKAVRVKKEHSQEKSRLSSRHERERTTSTKTRVSKTAVKKKKKK